MTSDPLDLLDRPASQPTKATGGGLGWLIVGLLLGIACITLYQRYQIDGGKADDQEHVEPAPIAKAKTLVFIHERNPQPIEHDLLLREMPSFCEANGLQFRALDDDTTDAPVPQMLEYASAAGIAPPFIVATDKDDKPARIMAWKLETDLTALKEFLR